jgi:hypothetical protein
VLVNRLVVPPSSGGPRISSRPDTGPRKPVPASAAPWDPGVFAWAKGCR